MDGGSTLDVRRTGYRRRDGDMRTWGRITCVLAAALLLFEANVGPVSAGSSIDASIALSKDGPYVNAGQDADGSDQRVTKKVGAGDSVSFWLKLKNKSEFDGGVRVLGDGDFPGYDVTYFDPETGADITSTLTSCTFTNLTAGEKRLFKVKVKAVSAEIGSSRTFGWGTFGSAGCVGANDLTLFKAKVV
jgi:hypothetical protein